MIRIDTVEQAREWIVEREQQMVACDLSPTCLHPRPAWSDPAVWRSLGQRYEEVTREWPKSSETPRS